MIDPWVTGTYLETALSDPGSEVQQVVDVYSLQLLDTVLHVAWSDHAYQGGPDPRGGSSLAAAYLSHLGSISG